VRGILLGAGILILAVPAYDQIAFAIDQSSGQQTFPLVPTSVYQNTVSSVWWAIIGAILILLAIFL
jgi:hypothetical protein